MQLDHQLGWDGSVFLNIYFKIESDKHDAISFSANFNREGGVLA